MLDDLRDQDPSQFFHDEEDMGSNNEFPDLGLKTRNHRIANGKFLGLKPQQLFILLILLLLVVCLLGTMLLLVTGKMVPSIL